jgi:hypothetical protein
VRSGEEIRMSSEPGTKSHDPGPWTYGDLARRLRDRRHALGLTLEDVEAWTGCERDLYVAVTPERVSGRRIHV